MLQDHTITSLMLFQDYFIALLSLNSNQLQLKLRLRLAFYPDDPATLPPTHPATYTPGHLNTRPTGTVIYEASFRVFQEYFKTR